MINFAVLYFVCILPFGYLASVPFLRYRICSGNVSKDQVKRFKNSLRYGLKIVYQFEDFENNPNKPCVQFRREGRSLLIAPVIATVLMIVISLLSFANSTVGLGTIISDFIWITLYILTIFKARQFGRSLEYSDDIGKI